MSLQLIVRPKCLMGVLLVLCQKVAVLMALQSFIMHQTCWMTIKAWCGLLIRMELKVSTNDTSVVVLNLTLHELSKQIY